MKMLILVIFSVLISAPVLAQQKKTENGRFQLIQLSNLRRDQYLLDTHTGKMWSKVCYVPSLQGDAASCEFEAWVSDLVEGVNASKEAIIKTAIKAKNSQQESNEK